MMDPFFLVLKTVKMQSIRCTIKSILHLNKPRKIVIIESLCNILFLCVQRIINTANT